MPDIRSSIVVSKSVPETFAFLNKAGNHERFIPNMIQFKQTTSGSFGRVGTKAEGILSIAGIKLPVDYEMIEHIPNNNIAMKGTLGPITFEDGYLLEQVEDKTRIKFWLKLEFKGASRLLKPFAGIIGKIHAGETLRNLKKVLEYTGT